MEKEEKQKRRISVRALTRKERLYIAQQWEKKGSTSNTFREESKKRPSSV